MSPVSPFAFVEIEANLSALNVRRTVSLETKEFVCLLAFVSLQIDVDL